MIEKIRCEVPRLGISHLIFYRADIDLWIVRRRIDNLIVGVIFGPYVVNSFSLVHIPKSVLLSIRDFQILL